MLLIKFVAWSPVFYITGVPILQPSAGSRPHPSLTSAVGRWPGSLVTAVTTVVHAPEITYQARGNAPAIPTAEIGITGSWGQKERHVMRT